VNLHVRASGATLVGRRRPVRSGGSTTL